MKTTNYILPLAAFAAGALFAKSKSSSSIGATIISKDRAREIASNWHGGQWSALYSFSSSGVYDTKNHVRYLKEIFDELENEYHAPYPRELKKKEERELKQLLKWFEYKGKENGITPHYGKHADYGYTIPSVRTPANMEMLRADYKA